MRELVAELFISLDGYAFSTNAGPYFDLYGPELGELIDERVAEPQELLMGWRTYQMLGEYAGSPESNDPLARRMDELPKTVLSHEASLPLRWTPARVVGGELPEVIGRLTSEHGPMLRTIGSVSIVRDLAAAQLLDQLRLVIFPIVLGPDGEEPIFAGHRDEPGA
jgi:dihydrofolate reductase